MKSIEAKAKLLYSRHVQATAGSMEEFLAGIKYVPEFSYEFDYEENKLVFNQPFHDLMLKIGVIDSEQSEEERHAVGQRYIIGVNELQKYL